MSIFAHLKKFDIYRDVPKDLTEQTLTGAIVSVCCMLLVLYLFLSEFFSFLAVETVSEMYVDPHVDHSHHATISIHMNFTVPRMPCAITSVDVQDVMGSHIVDYGGRLHKWRTNADGQLKYGPSGELLSHDSSPPLLQKGEGCNIEGHIIVKRVPGNFHVSAHAQHDLLSSFYEMHRGETLNCTHFIHNLHFGESSAALKGVGSAAVAPLSGASQVALMDESDGGAPRSYEYFLKVVPSKFDKLNGERFDAYQYVSNSNVITGRFQLPAIYFRYDFSPITVRFTERKTSLSHFLVQLCAIIGGVFTVLGLVNAGVLAASKNFKKRINKLG